MSQPLQLHPDDRTHFLWQGKARFLLGSTEHYGAVLNGAFDYERYLDTIAADRLNLTRTFTFYRELGEDAGEGAGSMAPLGYANTLTPRRKPTWHRGPASLTRRRSGRTACPSSTSPPGTSAILRGCAPFSALPPPAASSSSWSSSATRTATLGGDASRSTRRAT